MSLVAGLRSLWAPTGEVPDPVALGDLLVTGHGIGVSYGDRSILVGADFEARAGELVALVGPNGAGKSSLLGALTGDVDHTGEVTVFGAPLSTWAPAGLARRRAVLPQSVSVAFPFTVEEVVRMGRAPWQGTGAEELDDEIVRAAIVETDVAHLAHRSVPTLSGGERARVALARVLAQQPQLLLLDEPTAALDLHHQELTLTVVRARAHAGAAVVVVLHDLGLAAAHADRIVVISDGRIAADGTPAEVLHADLLSAVYHHPIEVLPHPRTGTPLVLPAR